MRGDRVLDGSTSSQQTVALRSIQARECFLATRGHLAQAGFCLIAQKQMHVFKPHGVHLLQVAAVTVVAVAAEEGAGVVALVEEDQAVVAPVVVQQVADLLEVEVRAVEQQEGARLAVVVPAEALQVADLLEVVPRVEVLPAVEQVVVALQVEAAQVVAPAEEEEAGVVLVVAVVTAEDSSTQQQLPVLFSIRSLLVSLGQ